MSFPKKGMKVTTHNKSCWTWYGTEEANVQFSRLGVERRSWGSLGWLTAQRGGQRGASRGKWQETLASHPSGAAEADHHVLSEAPRRAERQRPPAWDTLFYDAKQSRAAELQTWTSVPGRCGWNSVWLSLQGHCGECRGWGSLQSVVQR